MNIGEKIKKARIEAKFTQEFVAEKLQVSRQTISSWENEKTYPDIVSVIRMSDLYEISLDHLLKGEKPVNGYIEYLGESTNTVQSKTRLSKLIVIASYFIVWTMALIVYWCFTGPADVTGYSLIYDIILLPSATLMVSAIVAYNNYWGKGKWLFGTVLGVAYMLARYFTHGIRDMTYINEHGMSALELAEYAAFDGSYIEKVLTYGHPQLPKPEVFVVGTVISFVGILVGLLIRKLAAIVRNKSKSIRV